MIQTQWLTLLSLTASIVKEETSGFAFDTGNLAAVAEQSQEVKVQANPGLKEICLPSSTSLLPPPSSRLQADRVANVSSVEKVRSLQQSKTFWTSKQH